ncbi:MAG: molybdopterin molybdotransferase MoeA [Armatimonadetes bacterium]|nr:molybdopterin molybdotransferase MoeA [Armatimonadota bacterium]
MISVDEALRHILDRVHPLEAVSCGLLDALGRTLAEDIFATEPIAPFDNSAMDGYALIASDTLGATPEHPVRLSVLEDLPAGKVARHSVAPGSAIRIMTGAPVPGGADAVIMVEDTASGEDWVDIHAAVGAEANIRRAGEDVKPGERVLSQGMAVGPAEIGMMAGMGLTEAPVIRKPRVAVFSTGDEVVAPGEPLPPGKIRNSNLYALSAQVMQSGADIYASRHIPDDLDALEQAMTGASGADVIITAGGVSVGDYDLVKEVLARLGEMHFWRVAMKPGKPLVFGEIAGRFFFGLPGNPVSAMVTFEEFVRPALRKMAGCASWTLPEVEAVLEHDLKHSTGRLEFARARTRLENGQYVTASTGPQGSHQLRSMLGANSFILAPADRGLLPAGSRVRVQLLAGEI